jgi:rsbT co-antagonist protein RsbR
MARRPKPKRSRRRSTSCPGLPPGETAMRDPAERGRGVGLAQRMGIDERDIARRLRFLEFGPDDKTRVAELADIVTSRVDELTSIFFNYLSQLEEASGFFRDPGLLQDARSRKQAHLRAMMKGTYDLAYVEQRLELGALYAAAGLQTRVFLGAFHQLMSTIGRHIVMRFEKSPLVGYSHFDSLRKISFFDISLIVDVLLFERERLIGSQKQAIQELSTPVLQVRDGLLILPIIGVVDTQRARHLTETLLHAIRDRRAGAAVMDVTGVPIVDSRVANHIAQACEAARLMGAEVILTGLSPEISQALVGIGAILEGVRTVGDLQAGIEAAESVLAGRRRSRSEPVDHPEGFA